MASETVTQADREAAAEFAESIATRSKSERAEILRGDADLDCYVQAFAAHRTAAVAEQQDLLTIAYMAGVADEKARGRAAVAELVEAIERALKCTVLVRDSQIIFDREDPREILRSALSRHQVGLGKGEGG